MREIKFRAWDKKHKLISPVGRIDFGKTALIYQPVETENDIEWTGEDVPLDRLELMQFTGLKDKNGKEIYEGDIIEFEEPIMESAVLKCPIVFWEGMFVAEWDENSRVNRFTLDEINRHSDTDFEVIGNIYENPDLKPA